MERTPAAVRAGGALLPGHGAGSCAVRAGVPPYAGAQAKCISGKGVLSAVFLYAVHGAGGDKERPPFSRTLGT